MPTVRSERFPSLYVSDVKVRFIDGEAEIEDRAVLDRLRGLDHLGIVVPDEPPREPKKSPQKKPARKRD